MHSTPLCGVGARIVFSGLGEVLYPTSKRLPRGSQSHLDDIREEPPSPHLPLILLWDYYDKMNWFVGGKTRPHSVCRRQAPRRDWLFSASSPKGKEGSEKGNGNLVRGAFCSVSLGPEL